MSDRSKKYPMLSFRVSFEEKARAKTLAKSLKKRYPYLSASDVYRELIGFTDTGLITPEMRKSLLSETDFETAEVVTSKAKPVPLDASQGPQKLRAAISSPRKGGKK